jgi:NADPH:quinone reductase-like Zn-dependent oxidoreductase
MNPVEKAAAQAVKVYHKSSGVDALELQIETQAPATLGADACLIEVHAAAVNPSDVKAMLGLMPHAVWPRIPGRDYAGVVLDGAPHLIGKQVWGSGGDLGIRRDGSHARYLVVGTDSVREKPAKLSMEEASSVGVPFVTAFEGFRRAGGIQAGEVVLVLGANGKVGQAAMQLARRAGARVFGVQRGVQGSAGHAPELRQDGVTLLDAAHQEIDEAVRAATQGHGADIVFNTVGSPYFAAANAALAMQGRLILISTLERAVPFDIFAFYRGRHTYVGIDSLAMTSAEGAEILAQLAPDFEAGTLQPFPIHADSVFALARAKEAYRHVLGGAQHRVLLKP